MPGQSFSGVHAQLLSVHIDPEPRDKYFVDNDLWVMRYNARYFIEAGLIKGSFCTDSPPPVGSPCSDSTTEQTAHFFWTDQRPNGGFHAHLGGSANMNVYYNDDILHQNNGDWYVQVGSLSGTSRGWYDYADLLETGTETSNDTGSEVVCASQHELGWYGAQGQFHSGWADAEGGATLTHGNPPYAYWVDTRKWLREYANSSC